MLKNEADIKSKPLKPSEVFVIHFTILKNPEILGLTRTGKLFVTDGA